MHGIILALMLNGAIAGPVAVPLEASLTGGYHIGPAYALCEVATLAEPSGSFFNYLPLNVTYDFRFGLAWKGFDVAVSRYCTHNVEGLMEESGGWRLLMSYSNWKGQP